MKRTWAMAVFVPMVAFVVLYGMTTSVIAEGTTEPIPTVQPTPSFDVDVLVETQGIGIPDNLVMTTDLGGWSAYRHEDLGANYYRDYVQVHLESEMMWIFEHEGNLGIGGQRNDESWELFPVIVPTPLTMTVSIYNPVMRCQNTMVGTCSNVTGIQNQPVFTLEHNKSYHIDLRVDYISGATPDQDYYLVTSTIR